MIDQLGDSPFADLAFHKAALDALEANIALLDRHGTILFVNASWQSFGEANGIRDPRYGVGVNYFEACQAAVDPNARAAARGIRDVLSGRQPAFHLEYPCHSPDEQRWFVLRATRIEGYPGFAVVAHENVTERVIAESKRGQNKPIEQAVLVARRFPHWRGRIQKLLSTNGEFRSICDDYQELATWIDDRQSAHSDCKDLEDALELLDSLTDEISHFVGMSDTNVTEHR